MKKHLLERYTDINAELKSLKIRISVIEKNIEAILSKGNVKDCVKGGAGNMENFHIEGFPQAEYDDREYNLRKLRRILQDRQQLANEQLLEVERYVAGIKDSRIRRIIDYKYIKGLSWPGVARQIGGMATAESVRKELKRYIENEKK